MRSTSFNLIVALEVEEGEGGVAVAGDDAARGRLGCNSDTVRERARDRDVVRDVDRELRLASGEDRRSLVAAEEVKGECTVARARDDATRGSTRRDVDTIREAAADGNVVRDFHRELWLTSSKRGGCILALEPELAEESRVAVARDDAARGSLRRDGEAIAECAADGDVVRDVHRELGFAGSESRRRVIALEPDVAVSIECKSK